MKTVPISSIHLNDGKHGLPKNPRFIRDERFKALCDSIRDNPEYMPARPIVVNESGVILGGNMRFRACRELGMKELPASWVQRVVGWPIEKQRRFIILDNRGFGEDSQDDLANEWSVEELIAAGFDPDSLKDVIGDEQGNADAEPQVERAEELNEKWKVRGGDLWLIGEHRLLCGDSTKAEDVERAMGGEKADLCFTSPPYGVSDSAKLRDHYVRGAKKRESFYDEHADDSDAWPQLMDGWSKLAVQFCSAVACNVQMLAANKSALMDWAHSFRDKLVDIIIWDKGNAAPQMQKSILSNAFEFVFVIGGNGSRSIPFSSWHGTVSNVFHFDPRGKNDFSKVHRAVFPIDLPMWIIGTVFDLAQSIYEPFCGTGTTMVAAQNLGRKCYGLEISPAYCAVILERMATAFPELDIHKV